MIVISLSQRSAVKTLQNNLSCSISVLWHLQCEQRRLEKHQAQQSSWHLESFTRIAAHICIHHLDKVAFRKAKCSQLVACLSLRKVADGANKKAACAWQHMDDFDWPGPRGTMLDQHTGVSEAYRSPLSQAAVKRRLPGDEGVDHLLKLRVALSALEIDANEEGKALVLGQHVVNIVLPLCELRLLQPRSSTVHRHIRKDLQAETH